MLDVDSRVRTAHLCAALPSEPCVRLSPHTAQATCPEDSASPIAHGTMGPPLGSVC
jgi:hypothetical protein